MTVRIATPDDYPLLAETLNALYAERGLDPSVRNPAQLRSMMICFEDRHPRWMVVLVKSEGAWWVRWASGGTGRRDAQRWWIPMLKTLKAELRRRGEGAVPVRYDKEKMPQALRDYVARVVDPALSVQDGGTHMDGRRFAQTRAERDQLERPDVSRLK